MCVWSGFNDKAKAEGNILPPSDEEEEREDDQQGEASDGRRDDHQDLTLIGDIRIWGKWELIFQFVLLLS